MSKLDDTLLGLRLIPQKLTRLEPGFMFLEDLTWNSGPNWPGLGRISGHFLTRKNHQPANFFAQCDGYSGQLQVWVDLPGHVKEARHLRITRSYAGYDVQEVTC